MKNRILQTERSIKLVIDGFRHGENSARLTRTAASTALDSDGSRCLN
jgi:hypothetical protein